MLNFILSYVKAVCVYVHVFFSVRVVKMVDFCSVKQQMELQLLSLNISTQALYVVPLNHSEV